MQWPRSADQRQHPAFEHAERYEHPVSVLLGWFVFGWLVFTADLGLVLLKFTTFCVLRFFFSLLHQVRCRVQIPLLPFSCQLR